MSKAVAVTCKSCQCQRIVSEDPKMFHVYDIGVCKLCFTTAMRGTYLGLTFIDLPDFIQERLPHAA